MVEFPCSRVYDEKASSLLGPATNTRMQYTDIKILDPRNGHATSQANGPITEARTTRDTLK